MEIVIANGQFLCKLSDESSVAQEKKLIRNSTNEEISLIIETIKNYYHFISKSNKDVTFLLKIKWDPKTVRSTVIKHCVKGKAVVSAVVFFLLENNVIDCINNADL
jgi:hypothetical protein